jgi:2-dehydropantoate 2-reductase
MSGGAATPTVETTQLMRIVVVGVGGLGGLYGGLLAQHGEDVTFIARGESLAALRAHGLTVRSPSLANFTVPVCATDNPGELEPPELVLFCVKTYDLEHAAEQSRPLVGHSTVVLPLLNGIDATARIGRIVGERAVLMGMSYARSTRTAPATIEHMANTKIVLGEPSGGLSRRVEVIAQVLRGARIETEVHAAPELPLWEKLVAHGAFGGMAALTRLPLGPMLACHETRAMQREVILEIVAVARARGVPIPAESVERIANMADTLPPEARPSLLEDLVAGRRLELESTIGTVVRTGLEFGVPTPMNTAIYAALKPYASGAPCRP